MTPGLLFFLLAASSFYNGPGHSLHWLSLIAFLLAVWIGGSIWKQNLTHFGFASGWMPVCAILYVGWLAIAPLVSAYPYATWVQAAGLATLPLAALGWLFQPGEDREHLWKRAWQYVLLAGLLLGAWGIVDGLIEHQRARGPLLDANAFAALINLFLVPSAFAYLATPDDPRGGRGPAGLLVIVAVLALALALTLSRGGLLAFVPSLALVLWATRDRPNFRKHLPRLILVLAATYTVAKLAPIPQEDQRTTLEQLLLAPADQFESDQAIQQRLLLWRTTWRMIGDSNLLVGSGIGTFVTHYPAYRDPGDRTLGNHAHNDYLQMLFEGGLVQLSFLLAFVVVLPLWLLNKILRARREGKVDDITPGLLIGVLCVALHAFVSFVHFVVPVALLSGLYVGRAWEQVRPYRYFGLLLGNANVATSRLVTVLFLLVLAVPVAAISADGVIFKLFSSDGALADRLSAQQRLVVLNTAIAIRPGNPTPRMTLIRHLLDVAEHTEATQTRDNLLRWAQTETRAVEPSAAGTALVPFFYGKIMLLNGDEVSAQYYLETAVRRAPQSTMIRAELVKMYRKRGRYAEAHGLVRSAKQWLHFETSMASLAEFAREAQIIEQLQGNSQEVRFWSRIEIEAAASRKERRAT